MKDVVINFWTDGDRSVGIDGHHATVTLRGEYDSSSIRDAKEWLTQAFHDFFDDGKVHCATDDELEDAE